MRNHAQESQGREGYTVTGSRKYPGLEPGTLLYHRAASTCYRERLIARIGIIERRRRERIRMRLLRAKDRRPLEPEIMARMEASLAKLF